LILHNPRLLRISITTNHSRSFPSFDVIIKISFSELAHSLFLPRVSSFRPLTKEPVLPISLPTTPNFKLFAEDQERMIRNALAMVRLPFPLDPHNPDED